MQTNLELKPIQYDELDQGQNVAMCQICSPSQNKEPSSVVVVAISRSDPDPDQKCIREEGLSQAVNMVIEGESQLKRAELELDLLKVEQADYWRQLTKIEEDAKESERKTLGGWFHLFLKWRPSSSNGSFQRKLPVSGRGSGNLLVQNAPRKVSLFTMGDSSGKESDGGATVDANEQQGNKLYPSLELETVITERPPPTPQPPPKVEARQTYNGRARNVTQEGFSFIDTGRRVGSLAVDCFVTVLICLCGD